MVRPLNPEVCFLWLGFSFLPDRSGLTMGLHKQTSHWHATESPATNSTQEQRVTPFGHGPKWKSQKIKGWIGQASNKCRTPHQARTKRNIRTKNQPMMPMNSTASLIRRLRVRDSGQKSLQKTHQEVNNPPRRPAASL